MSEHVSDGFNFLCPARLYRCCLKQNHTGPKGKAARALGFGLS